MVDLNTRLGRVEEKVRKLENWQIKIALIVTAGAVLVAVILGWFVKYSLDRIAEQILNGGA